MDNLEEMTNLNRISLNNFLPIVKIQPGQKLEDIRKAAKALANKKLIQTTIMKSQEQARIEINNAIERLKRNPNDPLAKKAVDDANKKLAEIKKASKEIIKKGGKKFNNVINQAYLEAKIAREYLKNNPNDQKAKKAVEDIERKINQLQKASQEIIKKEKENAAKLLVENTIVKDLEKAEANAKAAIDFLNKNPKDPRAKKLADEANKKYQQAKQLSNNLINKLVDSKTISKENKNELTIKINEIDLNKLIGNLVSIMDYDGVVYICQSNSVRPLSLWAIKLNEIINKNKFTLLTVIPHYYYLDNKFNFVLIFVFNDDFCVILNKENLSQVLDVKSVLGTSFNPNIPDRINCDDLKVILEQMTKANVITANKSQSLLKRYKC